MSAAGFDVRAYSLDAQGSLRTRLSGVGEPIDDALRDLLRYLRERFGGTTTWLSLVLVTPTHKDARITAFLSTWAYERHWMSDALLALAGGVPAVPVPRGRVTSAFERLGPLREAVVANVHGRGLSAVHMTERVVDGALLDALLTRAVALAPEAVAHDLEHLREVLERQQEFFLETAHARLAESGRAQRLTRARVLARAWPIGAELDPAGTARALTILTEGDPGWAARLDARIEALPGLAGLGVMRRTAANPGAPALRTPLRPAAALGRLAASVVNKKG
ncbi:MAG TPA: hypothetical protein VIG76_04165 [Amnibacterium sp.]|uniref:hypothetical protein n=1 Tax=Amnibacterium sp. TaxID=1872496 RepID=UPI002F92F46E